VEHEARLAHARSDVRGQGLGQSELSLQSTSKGLSQGIQMGMGFKDRHGAGNSTDLPVPGMQTEALPKLTQGRM
jgi:hypothetical protein